MKNKKVLYFEGAGCVPSGEVENCRIRTAFKLDNGQLVYLELTGREGIKRRGVKPENQEKPYVGFIHFCYYINNDDDCNNHKIPNTRDVRIEYTKEHILNFVNSLGASFDDFIILDKFRVFREGRDSNGNIRYNFSEDIKK